MGEVAIAFGSGLRPIAAGDSGDRQWREKAIIISRRPTAGDVNPWKRAIFGG